MIFEQQLPHSTDIYVSNTL